MLKDFGFISCNNFLFLVFGGEIWLEMPIFGGQHKRNINYGSAMAVLVVT
jgi:hypothetical protein